MLNAKGYSAFFLLLLFFFMDTFDLTQIGRDAFMVIQYFDSAWYFIATFAYWLRVHNGTIFCCFCFVIIFWMKWQSSTQIEFHGHYVFIVNWVTNGFTCFSLCLLLLQSNNRMNFHCIISTCDILLLLLLLHSFSIPISYLC